MKIWQIIGVVVLLLLATAVACVRYWNDTGRLQAIGSLAAFVAAVLLIGATAVYVQTNRDMLSLLREQWNQTHTVVLRFGINAPNGNGQVWIANLGFNHVLITKISVTRHNGRRTTTLYKHAPVKAGDISRFSLPSEIWQDCSPVCDVEVRLDYEHFGKAGTTEAKAYCLTPSTVGVSKLLDVRYGLHGLWPVNCPKCQRHQGMFMRTAKLANFSEAAIRQTELESELRSSCPDHKSPWMLTVQDVNADTADRKESDS